MSTVSFTLTMTGKDPVTGVDNSPTFPAGTECLGVKCTLEGVNSIAPVSLAVGVLNGVFVDVPNGDYTFTAVALDAVGNPLGTPITGPVKVDEQPAAQTVTISVPAGFSYTVA